MTGSSFGGGGSGGGFSSSSSSSSSSAFSSWGSSGSFNKHNKHHHHNHHNYYPATPYLPVHPRPIYEEEGVPLIVNTHRRRPNKTRCCCYSLWGYIGAAVGCLFMIFGLYGSENLELGVNYSRLLTANKYFVQEISVEEKGLNGPPNPHLPALQSRNNEPLSGPVVYWFHNKPSLDDEREWTIEHPLDIPEFYHQEWAFWLNKGSELKLEYKVPTFSNLLIVIARGKENYDKWIDEPGNPDSCVLWKAVEGDGQIEFKTRNNDNYYIGIGNLQKIKMQVILKIQIKAKVYETKDADYHCPLGIEPCTISLPIEHSEVGVLTTPDKAKNGADVWFVKVSYRARWSTYIIIYGVMCLIILSTCTVKICSKHKTKRHFEAVPSWIPTGVIAYPEPGHSGAVHPGAKEAVPNSPVNDSSIEDVPEQNLCSVCYEEPKNAFFQPCGHCATCYTCGLRIQETSKECPICRNPIQNIGKIYIA